MDGWSDSLFGPQAYSPAISQGLESLETSTQAGIPAQPGIAHLVLFPRCSQWLHLMLAVPAFLQTQVAHRAPTAHAVHAVVLHFVLGACGELSRSGGSCAPWAPASSCTGCGGWAG